VQALAARWIKPENAGALPRKYRPQPRSLAVAIVPVTVHYLEMTGHSHQTVPPPRDGLLVLHAKRPPVAYYRFLYGEVGRDYHWYSRGRLSDRELAAAIHDPLAEVHVLHVEGVPAGFAELERRQAHEIELVQFGLTREFIGKGLGKWFLRWVIDKVWSYHPKRFWLHTCTLDHPAALPSYLRAGFTEYKRDVIQREI
jgi:GNAT superfamily N-acetyltransferase